MRFLLTLCVLVGFSAESKADCGWYPGKFLFGGRCRSVPATATVCDGNQCKPVKTAVAVVANTVANIVSAPIAAIDQVNALRASAGLSAYIHDEQLTAAAVACATARAKAGIHGHTANDFAFLPEGVRSSCAGCAAWPVEMGFGACAIYDRYKFCGAATVIGPDGKAYHHAFYR